jgi:hypothetical protein
MAARKLPNLFLTVRSHGLIPAAAQRVPRRHSPVLRGESSDGFKGHGITDGVLRHPFERRPVEYARPVRIVGTWVRPRGLEPVTRLRSERNLAAESF